MPLLWKRRIQITINVLLPRNNTYEEEKWEFDSNDNPLRADFRLRLLATYPYPQGEIKIYNLAPITRRFLSAAARVTVSIGYENDRILPVVFKGSINWSETKHQGNDVITIFLIGGRLEFDQNVEVSYEDPETLFNVCKDLVDQAADQVNIRTFGAIKSDLELGEGGFKDIGGNRIEIGRTPENFSASGKFASEFSSVLQMFDRVWHCAENGIISVLREKLSPLSDVAIVNSDTGMIGTPTENKDGVSVKMLLDPRVNLRTFIQIRSKNLPLSEDNRYSPTEIEHTGSTWTDQWYTRVEAA